MANTTCISVKDEQVHLCIWNLQKSEFIFNQNAENLGYIFQKSIQSPKYFAPEFVNLKWFFVLKKLRNDGVYDLLLFCESVNKSNMELNFTFAITTKFVQCSSNTVKCSPLIINGVRNHKIVSFFISKFNPETNLGRNFLMEEMTIVCRITQNKKSFQFLRSFESFYLKEKLSDVLIVVKEKQFHAHKVILVANSPVFLGMFSHQMIENISSKLEIDDFEPKVVKEFLRYLYTGKISNWDNYIDKLFAIAHKYQVEDLKNECALLLFGNLTIENVIHVLILSDLYDSEDLKQKCLGLINTNYEKIRDKGDLQHLERQPRLLMDILKATSRQIHEGTEPVIESSIEKIPSKTSCLWTVNNYWEYCESPHFHMETGNPGKYFSWWFRMVESKLLLCLAKDDSAAESFLELTIVLQNPLTLKGKRKLRINLDDKCRLYNLIQWRENVTKLILFCKAELIPNRGNQMSNLLRNFEGELSYEFFFRNTNCSDVTLYNQGRQFPAHKILLANRSEKFKKVFLPTESLFDFTKKNETQGKKIENLRVDHLKPTVFEKFLNFIYNGDTENLDNLANDLYLAASEYEVQDLKLVCENILLTSLNEKNIISSLIFSEKYNIECLKDKCIFLVAKFLEEIEENELKSLERTYPKLLMEILEVKHTGRRFQSIENSFFPCFLKETGKKIISYACGEVWYLCLYFFTAETEKMNEILVENVKSHLNSYILSMLPLYN
ncbi:uncharacterized protein LOC117172404 [Belonocnema kinseyi]|uniref:uncharacterized protein LOC117172404 n=1 Tax=Belonocnema kinseyi TaxID=2817044 RepID=UPI00143D656B|nr:uncharacterized protein LOC117172404 [Belonocnema kinseyi]XP_033216199.1 uncharacterized protein LOC117172404 [Belonocnema kinseyi]XP_033216210.1 uncharacterized protein LOC117172404 [Belonocnema kinseyi]XP_033216218.1 uncharacterized protein LOC117172404 [Belonocnema kinseyi]